MATAMVKNKPDKKNRNKDPLSIKIKIRNTTRGVENIAILHSTPVDPKQPKKMLIVIRSLIVLMLMFNRPIWMISPILKTKVTQIFIPKGEITLNADYVTLRLTQNVSALYEESRKLCQTSNRFIIISCLPPSPSIVSHYHSYSWCQYLSVECHNNHSHWEDGQCHILEPHIDKPSFAGIPSRTWPRVLLRARIVFGSQYAEQARASYIQAVVIQSGRC